MKGLQNFVCLDLETTGLDPRSDRIIEIGMVRVREGKVEAQFSTLINPMQQLEKRIEEITGITQKDLENQPQLRDVLPQILEFLGEDVLLGHRILFDYSFLKRAFTNEKIPFERKGIDTLKIARKVVSDCESKSLPNLCKHYGIEYQPHRALSDVLATLRLYERLSDLYYEEEIFAPKPLLYKVKKESPITKAQMERLSFLLEKHSLICPVELTSMTRNESSRYIDRILSTYGR